MEASLPFTLIPIAVCIYLFSILYRQFTSPLRSVGGPLVARFTDGWYCWRIWCGNFHQDNQILHNAYGPVVRYGPNRYSLNDPAASKIIYGHKMPFPKSSWYSAWGQPQPHEWTIFSDRDIKRHGKHRKQYQNIYSLTSLVTYEPFVDECVSLFHQRLTELAASGLPINIGHWMQCYAFDVISLMTYSKRLGFLDQGEDVAGVISALEGFLRYSSLAGLTPSLHPYMVWFKNWMSGTSGTGRAYVVNFTKQCVAEHKADPQKASLSMEDVNPTSKLDFLSKFYVKHAQDPETFTAYHVVAGCTQNMVAGSDTTAITLSACLYYLLKTPQSFHKLRDEVDKVGRKEERGQFTFKESQDMQYLQAVIKETLRMHPATGLPLERVVPKGGMTISNHFFPEGTIVGVNSWVEHRNPQIWGHDAHEFKPERWLTDDDDKLAYMNRHWMPFGLGSRVCLGRHISFLEISKLIPALVSDFDFELCGALQGPTSQWKVDDYWFVKPKDFVVRVKLRRHEVLHGSY